MGDFGKLRRPWTWLGVTLVSWAIGILTMFLAFGTVFLWQQELLPPEQVRTNELLVHSSFTAWAKHWTLLIFWVILYGVALFSGLFTGPLFYRWAVRRFDLLRWRDGSVP